MSKCSGRVVWRIWEWVNRNTQTRVNTLPLSVATNPPAITKPSILLDGGAEGARTPDPHNAIVVLYQLSYDPIRSGRQSKWPPPLVKTFFAYSRNFGDEGWTLSPQL